MSLVQETIGNANKTQEMTANKVRRGIRSSPMLKLKEFEGLFQQNLNQTYGIKL